MFARPPSLRWPLVCLVAAVLACHAERVADAPRPGDDLDPLGDGPTLTALDGTTSPAGMERPALWVDDDLNADDCAHDAIVGPWLDAAVRPYIRLQEGIARTGVYAPGPNPCIEGGTPVPPPLDHLLRFRMLFWHVSSPGAESGLGALTAGPNGVGPQDLAEYVRAGGGLVVWGRHTIGHLLGGFFPPDAPWAPDVPEVMFPNFGPGTFVWDVMKLRTMFDAVGRGASRPRGYSCSGIVGLEATPAALAEGYPAGVLDPSGYSTDPTNTTVTPRTAIWIDGWSGRQHPFGGSAVVPLGVPPLHVEGLDTLYTYISNSWAYVEDGPDAVRDVCGTVFASPFEGQPIVMRLDDPLQGRIVWIGTTLWNFAENHDADIQLIMEKLAAWVLEEG